MIFPPIVAKIQDWVDRYISGSTQTDSKNGTSQAENSSGKSVYMGRGVRSQIYQSAFADASPSSKPSGMARYFLGVGALAGCNVSQDLNRPPQISPIDDQFVNADDPVDFSIEATDPDGDRIFYQLWSGDRPGMELNRDTGAFHWLPTLDDVGDHMVTFAVQDERSSIVQGRITVLIRVLDPDIVPNCDPTLSDNTDQDEDGFPSNVDCDDCRPSKFPLRDNQVNTITDDATICPGTYSNVHILMENLEDVRLRGPGVTLEGVRPENADQGIVLMRNSHDSILSGFTFLGEANAVRLENSNNNTLRLLTLSEIGCSTGIYLFASSGNLIEQVNIDGPGTHMVIDHDATMMGGAKNTVMQSNFTASSSCLTSGFRVFSGSDDSMERNTIFENSFDGVSLNLSGLGGNYVHHNNITNNLNGVTLQSSRNEVSENEITGNSVGILIRSNAHENNIHSNDLSDNSMACIEEEPGAMNNSIVGNICN